MVRLFWWLPKKLRSSYARPRLNWWLNWYSPVITSVITKPYLKIVSEMSSPNSLVKCHHQNRYWNVITKIVSEMSSPNSLVKCHHQMVRLFWWLPKKLRSSYARPRLNWWLNWYSPVITSVITKPYLKIVSEMSSPNSLVKCHHQNRYWNVITKFVSEMSSPKSLLKCHHQNRYSNVITKWLDYFGDYPKNYVLVTRGQG